MQATCKPYALADIEHMKVHGRTTAKRSPLTLYWTGSGIELNVQGSELWVELESADGVYEQWITVAVNGFVLIRQMVPAGRSRICLFRGMDGSKVKNVRLMHGDGMADLGEDLQVDAIVITAGTSRVPEVLFKYLKTGGRMVLPLAQRGAAGDGVQRLTVIEATPDGRREQTYDPVRFVPLLPGLA